MPVRRLLALAIMLASLTGCSAVLDRVSVGKARAIYAGAVAADVATTAAATNAGAREINPVLCCTHVPERAALTGLIPVALCDGILRLFVPAESLDRSITACYLTAATVRGGAAVWNTTQIIKETHK
jgi:uncharacterized protein YceK